MRHSDDPNCDEKAREIVVDSWKSLRGDTTVEDVLDELGWAGKTAKSLWSK